MNIRSLSLEKIDYRRAIALPLAVAVLALPAFVHNQAITGPLVNLELVVLLFLLGRREALIFSFLPSIVALSGGLLPFAAAPLLPFIMASNVILVLTLDHFSKNFAWPRGYFKGAFGAAFLKFAFLFLSVRIGADAFFSASVASLAAKMFGATQFVSAIIGLTLAFPILLFFRRPQSFVSISKEDGKNGER
jgi:hypothetical protein